MTVERTTLTLCAELRSVLSAVPTAYDQAIVRRAVTALEAVETCIQDHPNARLVPSWKSGIAAIDGVLAAIGRGKDGADV